MNVQERVYQALRKDAALSRLLAHDRRGPCIYHGKSPDAGSYPVLIYSVVSDVPALSADGEEIERRVTVRERCPKGYGTARLPSAAVSRDGRAAAVREDD